MIASKNCAGRDGFLASLKLGLVHACFVLLVILALRADTWTDPVTDLTIDDGVTEIREGEFAGRGSIVNVAIPASVTNIADNAFAGCAGVRNVTVPQLVLDLGLRKVFPDAYESIENVTVLDGVTRVPGNAFRTCSGIKSVSVPSSVRSIGNCAFRNCSGLASLDIPIGVSTIGNYAFAGCSALSDITIPDGVENIGYYAFKDCASLSEISMPSNVVRIGTGAFLRCTGIRNVTVSQIVLDKQVKNVFPSAYAAIANVVVPESVTHIPDNAFAACTGIRNVTVPQLVLDMGLKDVFRDAYESIECATVLDGATSIPNNAFRYCSGIKRVSVPSGVGRIGSYAFWACRSLADIDIPSGVTSIGTYAFAGCSALSGIAIPDGVVNIGNHAFKGCAGLSEVSIPASVTRIGTDVFLGCTGIGSVTVSQAVLDKQMREVFASACASIEHVTIRDGVTNIPSAAFSGCTALRRVSIPSSVEDVDVGAFVDMPSVEIGVAIEDGVTEIREREFAGRDWIVDVAIPSSVTNIADNAFAGCTNICSVEVPQLVLELGLDKVFPDAYASIERVTILDGATSIPAGSFSGYAGLKSVEIPSSVTSIGEDAFHLCSGLESVTIPQSVLDCGLQSVFPDAYETIEHVTMLDGVTVIPEQAFGMCTGLVSVTMPESLQSIEDLAFCYCYKLMELSIPDNVSYIGFGAFLDCSALESVCIPRGVPYISAMSFYECQSLSNVTILGNVTGIGHRAFTGCGLLTEISIPDSVTDIGDEAFSVCGALTSVTIPDGVSGIGCGAFIYCSALTNVTFIGGVTRIGDAAFYHCSSLEEVALPDSLRSIGTYAFADCTNLTEVTMHRGVEVIEDYAFSNCPALARVSVPCYCQLGYMAFDSRAVWDEYAAKLGDLDPFSCPEGSTNTVLEHVFYSGTTNGVVAYPTSTVDTAVLKVTVRGEGMGRIFVGDSIVPLIAPTSTHYGVAADTLLLPVERGVWWEVGIEKPEELEVDLASDDLIIGLQDCIAFPHTDATIPCIHDFVSNAKTVSLVHGEEFPGLTATWECESVNVWIEDAPPVSAKIHGHFKKNQDRDIVYTVDHPCRLNPEPLKFSQKLRFCPQLEDERAYDMDDNEGWEDPFCWMCGCPMDASCSCCSGEWCDCGGWMCQCGKLRGRTNVDDPVAAEEAFTNIVNGTRGPLPDVLYLYRSNTRTLHLSVPVGARSNCCSCPDHCHSNYVAKVSCTRSVAVKDSLGDDFHVAYKPCDVTVSGVFPSSEIGGSVVAFVTNGVECSRHNYTVLGIKFESADGRHDVLHYNRRSPSFGYPVHVCTNLTYAESIAVKADVFLEDGFFRLSLEDAEGDVELWLPEWDDDDWNTHPAEMLLSSRTQPVRYFTARDWRNIAYRCGDPVSIKLKVISSSPQSFAVRCEFAAEADAGYIYDYALQRITTVRPTILPDYNWDMKADIKDALDLGNRRQHYFWINNDTWTGDDAFAPYSKGSQPWPITLPSNGRDKIVNGRNDLVNLCPFAVDVSPFLREWGANGVRYVFYVERPCDVKFVPVRTEWAHLDKLVKEDQKTIMDTDLHSSALHESSGEVGYELPLELVSLGASGAGVIAVEFAMERLHSLRIAVEDTESGALLFESSASVNAMDVHKMYRWLNLDYVCGEKTDAKYEDRLTVDWPDTEHADANVVFVHGYNMHPSEAWDWSQAMFKRLRWSGMDAGFTAVLWRGNESQMWVPKIPPFTDSNAYATPNYHQNVLNAFRTAETFASRVNALPGEKKYMIAHSLGNMLVSASRQFHGLQYEKYFMLNAAVPVEAYDPVGGVTEKAKNAMTPESWREYPDRVRSAHWYELFLDSPGDERQKMTWKGIFKDVDKTVNFYSSKDEVVADGDGGWKWPFTRNFAWYNQERARGKYLVSLSPQAGWKFSGYYSKTERVGSNSHGTTIDRRRRYYPSETYEISNASLRVHPFFKDFQDSGIYGDGGSAFLKANPQVWWYSLSHGIPAESLATGANPVPKWVLPKGGKLGQTDSDDGKKRNYDMATTCNPAGPSSAVEWTHSYFIQKSLLDTRKLYEKLANQIGTSKKKMEYNNE